jgi:hypothetical protein
MRKRIAEIARHRRDRQIGSFLWMSLKTVDFGVDPAFKRLQYRSRRFRRYRRLLRFPWPPLKIYRNETFGLALKATIAQGHRPPLPVTIVFQAPIFHRFVLAFAHVVQNNPGAFIFCHRKTDPVGATASRHAGASPGVAEITEVAQFRFCWGDLPCSGMACSSKAGA